MNIGFGGERANVSWFKISSINHDPVRGRYVRGKKMYFETCEKLFPSFIFSLNLKQTKKNLSICVVYLQEEQISRCKERRSTEVICETQQLVQKKKKCIKKTPQN